MGRALGRGGGNIETYDNQCTTLRHTLRIMVRITSRHDAGRHGRATRGRRVT
jgi:hypothetical protein